MAQSQTQNQQYAAAIDRAYRWASKVPALEISSSDPTDTATDVPIDKTITITFSMPMNSVNNTNITIDPNVARTTSLDGTDYRIVTITPDANLANNTEYTVTMTTNVRGLYGPWTVEPSVEDSISFTTVA